MGKQVGVCARGERAFTAVEKKPSEIAPALGGGRNVSQRCHAAAPRGGLLSHHLGLVQEKEQNKRRGAGCFNCLKYLSTSALLPNKGMPPTNPGSGSRVILLVFRARSW